jgi:phosphoglycolate phosphatase
VLFDLDGTLIDSAPDLAGTANDLRERHGLAPLPFERLRPMVGAVARGMIGAAFGMGPDHPEFPALRDAFLEHYATRSLQLTRPFDEVPGVLDRLEASGLPWGIVTNKIERFTGPIVEGLGLARRAATVIAGDTTPHAKPHPAPLLEAARRIGLEVGEIVYVGDDLRDIQAGQAAGMRTVAAAWGYLGEGLPIEQWGADHVAPGPVQVLKFVGLD